jgi:hypothetical protein
MIRTILTSFFLLTAAFLLGSCSGDPTSSGAGLLPDSLVIVTATATGTSDTNYIRPIGGNLTDLLIGKTTDLESRTLMEFTFAPLDPSARLDSGVLVLQLKQFMPSSGGILAFSVHRMTTVWNDAAFTWDSIPGSFDPAASGSFSASVSDGDSVIRIPVDTALIRAWSDSGKGSLMLIPRETSTVIAGFHSHLLLVNGHQPVLEISYRDAADTTVVKNRNANRGVFVTEATIAPAPPDVSILQAAVSLRSYILFDSLSLPPGAGIAEAYIELTADTNSVPGAFAARDSLSVSFVQDHVFPLDSLVLTGLGVPVIINGMKVYRADIRTFVQLWNTREPNRGIVLRALGDLTTVDRIAVYNSSAADSLRPRIRLTFTRFP